MERPLHLILRYVNAENSIDTIAEHQSVDKTSGSVWWGKFGLGASDQIINKLKKQLEEQVPTRVFLARGATVKYECRLLDIVGSKNSRDATLGSPDPDKTPRYYRNKMCALWLEVSDIRKVEHSVVGEFVSYNDPSLSPRIRGGRALIYIASKKNCQCL